MATRIASESVPAIGYTVAVIVIVPAVQDSITVNVAASALSKTVAFAPRAVVLPLCIASCVTSVPLSVATIRVPAAPIVTARFVFVVVAPLTVVASVAVRRSMTRRISTYWD
jgi:hypothetical protein